MDGDKIRRAGWHLVVCEVAEGAFSTSIRHEGCCSECIVSRDEHGQRGIRHIAGRDDLDGIRGLTVGICCICPSVDSVGIDIRADRRIPSEDDGRRRGGYDA